MRGKLHVPAPDPAMERATDLRRVDELLRLQRHAPAPVLADDVLRRIHRPRQSLVDRFLPRARRRWLRPLALSVSVASALALTVGTLGYRAGVFASRSIESARGPTLSTPLSVQRIVRLALSAPGAQSVGVVGDFNGWESDRAVPMARLADGRFMTTLELAPGRYAYAFVVDGVRVQSDPHALVWEDDGFGGRNSVVEL